MVSREIIDRAVMRRRLLLVLFAIGTNVGIRYVAGGDGGETEAIRRRVRRLFVNRDNLRGAITRLVNATFAARDEPWWAFNTGHRLRLGLKEVWLVVVELHDRVPRPLRRGGRDDLLARPGSRSHRSVGQSHRLGTPSPGN